MGRSAVGEAQAVIGGQDLAADHRLAGLVQDGQCGGAGTPGGGGVGGADAEVGVQGGEVCGEVHYRASPVQGAAVFRRTTCVVVAWRTGRLACSR